MVLKIMRKPSAPDSGDQVDGDRAPAAGWPDSCESAATPVRLSRAEARRSESATECLCMESTLELNGNRIGGSLFCTASTVILPPEPPDPSGNTASGGQYMLATSRRRWLLRDRLHPPSPVSASFLVPAPGHPRLCPRAVPQAEGGDDLGNSRPVRSRTLSRRTERCDDFYSCS